MIMAKRILILFFALTGILTSCRAQPPQVLSTTNKKAEKAYRAAQEFRNGYKYEEALAEIGKAVAADPNFAEAYLLKANIHGERRQWAECADAFNKAFGVNPNISLHSYYDCAMAEMKVGRYADAKKHYQEFIKRNPRGVSQAYFTKAEIGVASCDFAMNAIANPVPFNPVNAGNGINSAECEYFPNLTADESMFLFTRNSRKPDENGVLRVSQEDFFVSYRNPGGEWSVASGLSPMVNSDRNEGAPSLSPDGRFLFFAACEEYGDYGNGRQGFGSCDIFFTKKVNGQWSRASNVGGPLNTRYWESQPSFSSDGKTLYYVSNRPGGLGDGDIWMSILQPDNSWSQPVNLGETINTPGREEGVFIHPDNQTLYFASSGHVGMGGLDLYVSRRMPDGNWGKPENLGYPINTFKDESGLIVNSKGDYAYFSSDREGTAGCEDIYMFELPKSAQPVQVTYMKGKVFNKRTTKPLSASFELIDLETGTVVAASMSDPVSGEFLVCIPVNKNYALNVSSPGYLFYSETFQLKASAEPGKPVRMDVPMQPIEPGVAVDLKNVFFETGKFDLRPESKAELDKLIAFLTTNPNIRAELSGHTDNVGSPTANLTLSQNRAKAVVDYLVAGGIDASRLTSKGYGDTKPKAPNDTPENRQKNRRTEFTVISN